MKYAVIIEQGPTSFGAYVPDLPICVAAGDTRDEVLTLIRGAIELHIEASLEDGDPVSESGITIDDAMEYHIALLAEYGETDSEPDNPVSVVEVEVSLPQPAAELAGHGVGGG